MSNKLMVMAGLATLGCLSTSQAFAGFIQIPQPTAAYQSATTLIPITAPACTATGEAGDPCPAGSIVSSMSANGFTLSFSSPDSGNLVIARAAVPVGWATWNTPPAVESSTPRVLQDLVNLTCSICTLDLSFSVPVKTFGFEAEPDPLSNSHTLTATFFNGATQVGVIPFTFGGGSSSARLFAGSTDDQQFTNVRITIDGTDFAMAQFRFGATAVNAEGNPIGTVPEPGTVLLMLGGLAAIGYRKFRKA